MTGVTTGSRPVTAEDLARLPRGTWRYELVRGELRRMSPAGHVHGRIAATFTVLLGAFVREHTLGVVYAAETGFLLAHHPDTVRAPDCAFVCAARLAAAAPGSDGFFPGPPDLAVEVISPSDAYSEVEEKVAEWLEAGCQAVLLVDPRRRMVVVHRPAQPVVPFGETDRLAIPDLLPGWSLSLEEVFR